MFAGGAKQRILFLITQPELGGAQRFFYNLISRLDKTQYELLVVSGPVKTDNYIHAALRKEKIDTRTINSLDRKINFWSDLKAVFTFHQIIKDYRPDIVFLNSTKAGFIGALATIFPKKIHQLKVIYRIGGWTFNDPWPHWKKRCYLILEKISAPWKDYIIVNNTSDLTQATELGIKPRKKILCIANGIDAYKLELLDREEARTKLLSKIPKNLNKNTPKIVIGTIANAYPAKGLDQLIAAVQYLNKKEDLVFWIIGDGPERGNLERLIKEKGLEHKIFLLGKIPDAYRYLPAFDIFVLPSVKEGSPWSVIEAMAAKVPVLATAVGGVPDIIESEKNGILVPPAKPEALAKELMRLLANDNLRQELSIQAHQTVLFKHDLDKMVNRFQELFNG